MTDALVDRTLEIIDAQADALRLNGQAEYGPHRTKRNEAARRARAGRYRRAVFGALLGKLIEHGGVPALADALALAAAHGGGKVEDVNALADKLRAELEAVQ